MWLFLRPFSVISCPPLQFCGMCGVVVALFPIVHTKMLTVCIVSTSAWVQYPHCFHGRKALGYPLCLVPGNVVVRADGKCGVACPCPAHALQSTGLRPCLLGHADITAETPIPWPQKLCFRASILSLCTQFTASYSSFGSFSCSGAWGVFDSSLSPNCHCAVWLCFLLAPCGLSAAYCCAFFHPLDAFLILGCWIWGMKKCWRDKYQSGNEQIANVLDLEAKHGLFGCQANLKMLSAVAKVHEKCNKLFPRVLRSLRSSNPKVPGGLSIRRDTCLVLPCRRNMWECSHLPDVLYLQTYSSVFLVIPSVEMVLHRGGFSAEGKGTKTMRASQWRLTPVLMAWKIKRSHSETSKLSKTL